MIRYKLSRLFTNYAEHFVPGDRFLQASAAELMQANRDHYRDTLIESIQTLFEKFDSGLILEHQNAGTGKALLKVSSPQKYPGLYPVEFELSTETSDFLMATGREAVFCIQKGTQEKLFYYGNAWNPDNHSQHLGMPRYIAEVQDIAQHLSRETYAELYARWQNSTKPPAETKRPSLK